MSRKQTIFPPTYNQLSIKHFAQIINHFWPDFDRIFEHFIQDPRQQEKIVYPARHLFFTVILNFAFRMGSFNKIKFMFRRHECAVNLSILAKTHLIPTVAHPDTIAYLFKRIDPGRIQELKVALVRRLIRKRSLEQGRLLNTYYMIAIDATRIYSSKTRHCPKCLTSVHNKKTVHERTCYFHNVLEAKLVTPNGLALSIASEFIENPSGEYDKQDCERKAFYRLAKKLKAYFPQLKICLLMDGLYAVRPVFDICKKNNWQVIITFKEGSLPERWDEYQRLKTLSPKNRSECRTRETFQTFSWVNELPLNDHKLSAFECHETAQGRTAQGEGRGNSTKHFVWLSTLPVNIENIKTIAQGGRLRWKIENEGFNTQKNGGFALEHAYCRNWQGGKISYVLLQIAHLFLQLLDKSVLTAYLRKGCVSDQGVSFILMQTFINSILPVDLYDLLAQTKRQVRLFSG